MFKEKIVDAYIRAASGPMVWGADDCCQWVRKVVLAHVGLDLMESIPEYDSLVSAYVAMDGCLIKSVIKVADGLGLDQIQFPYISSDAAIVGIVAGEFGPALAIKYKNSWLARAQRGIAVLPNRNCVMAWKVF